MKKNINNKLFIEGRLYQYDLSIKTVQNKESKNYGTEFISGTLDIATDEEGLNVISVHYTYVTPVTGNGKTNFTYTLLKQIHDGGKAWVTDGKDEAMKLRLTPALALNDFYNANGELVAAKRNEGGFVSVVRGELSPIEQRNRFDFDMVITRVTHVDATENYEEYLKIGGAIFDFRGALLPVELVCRMPAAFNYFDSIEASAKNPVFTQVKGAIVSTTIQHKIEEPSAFGTVLVRTVPRNIKEYAIDWVRPVEYEFGYEDTITAEELKKAMQDREVYLADVKKRHDEYLASRNNSTAAPVVTEDFNF